MVERAVEKWTEVDLKGLLRVEWWRGQLRWIKEVGLTCVVQMLHKPLPHRTPQSYTSPVAGSEELLGACQTQKRDPATTDSTS